MNTRILMAILCATALAAFLPGCGGGGGGGDPVLGGDIQVLNNTGQDLADVEVWQSTTMITEIGGGLVSGGSWTFANLPPGVYSVHALTPGNPFGIILFYDNQMVQSGVTTNVTMTP